MVLAVGRMDALRLVEGWDTLTDLCYAIPMI